MIGMAEATMPRLGCDLCQAIARLPVGTSLQNGLRVTFPQDGVRQLSLTPLPRCHPRANPRKRGQSELAFQTLIHSVPFSTARNQLLDSTTTNASGVYVLRTPGPGDFRIRVLLPTSQDTFSPKDAPPSDLLDSDVNSSGATPGFTDVYALASGTISVTSVDGGVIVNTLFANGFE